MYETRYAHTRRISGTSPEQVLTRVREALAREGFGVLTEIDVQAYVQAVRPQEVFRLVDNPAVQPIAEDVDARLQRVLATL
jgi:uncharacterized protein (DUF302 family)